MKKLLATLLASAMAVSAVGGLVACGGDGYVDDPNRITVWAPDASVSTYEKLIESFKEANPDYAKYDIKVIAKGEGNVQGDMGTAPKKGAEVFFFASDHFGNMRANNYLQPLTDDYAALVKERDEESTYKFVTDDTDNKIYAFPATNDNGYFLWYDSEFYTEEEVKSLDVMQAKAKEAKMHIMYDYNTAFYCPMFFIGMGCQFGYTDTAMKHYRADLQTPEAKAALTAMYGYASKEKNYINFAAKNRVITAAKLAPGFAERLKSEPAKDGQFVAGISGTWEASSIKDAIKTALGREATKEELARFKPTALPKFKAQVEGQEEKEYNLGSFVGGKYCGVNRAKSPEKIQVSLALAEYFTNEAGQLARFESTNAGPSNKKAAASEKVLADPGLVAYNAQLATKANIVQGAQSDAFWGNSGIMNLVKDVFTSAEAVNTLEKAQKALADLSAGLNT